MPIALPAQAYDRMIFRAAEIRQSEEGTSYETDLAEVRLARESFYFIKDPVTGRYNCVCLKDSARAADTLEKSEARPFVITDKSQIKGFIESANAADGEGVTRAISGLVRMLEAAKKKGRGY